MPETAHSPEWEKLAAITRILGAGLLLAHYYFFCHLAFLEWHHTNGLADRIAVALAHAGLFHGFNRSKVFALALMAISMVGTSPTSHRPRFGRTLLWLLTGTGLYFGSAFCLVWFSSVEGRALAYMICCSAGFVIMLTSGLRFRRLIGPDPAADVFNRAREAFPQQEKKISNPYSVNLPASYRLGGRNRRSWVNIINPFRGLLVLGTPGSGKSHFIIREVIRQHIRKGFSMMIYDFKYDDLTRIAYQELQSCMDQYPVPPVFHIVHFDDLARSCRCNPLDPAGMKDVTDAAEAARTVMLGLNQEWIRRQGDFFVESPIHFVTALIWYLRSFQGGKYCTLPHAVELARVPYDKLFTILRSEPQTEALVYPFITAYLNNAMEQLEGQIASATISLSRLSSPDMYYILSGNETTLDIANPLEPKILCIGNNPQKSQTYGPVAALYITALARLLNRKGNLKSSLIFDEFPTIYLNGIDRLIATARSNRVATTLAVQDVSQLRLYYGRDLAEVILNITGNIISGQVSGETARQLSDRFGRILQDRQSQSVNDHGTTTTYSSHLEPAIPSSRISSLSTGEFVGLMADDLENPLEQKIFHGKILPMDKEAGSSLPEVPRIREPDPKVIEENFLQVRRDIASLVQSEMERILSTPVLSALIVKK